MASSDATVHNETCPLLHHSHVEAQTVVLPTPLPKGQFAALCAVRLVDPLTFTQLFPYVNDFMSDLHVTDDPSRIGFYSGLVESIFAICQLCSIYPWAKISDVIGRRTVILAGLLSTVVVTLAFGLSKSLEMVLITRCLGGLLSGTVAAVLSALGEMTDSTNQAYAIPIFGLMWPFGAIVGPLIGGTFSHGASKYPHLFGYTIFEENPYFLPCLISSLVTFIGVLLGFIFLEETHPDARQGRDGKCNSMKSHRVADDIPVPEQKPMSVKDLMALPAMCALVTSGFVLSFISTAFDVIFVLFCFSSIESGGLGFSASQIGYCLAISGFIAVGLQICLMPYLLRWFDSARLYVFCMGLWPFGYLCLPFLNAIARGGLVGDNGLDASTMGVLWIGIAFIYLVVRVSTLAYSLHLILVKERSPSPASLSQSHGVVQFAMCSARAFAPFLASSLFAVSIDNDILGGYLWVIVMVIISVFASVSSRNVLPDRKTNVI
ncbi:major facilitator superfamily domain-containing protein [Scleroderma yunnanense]